MAKPRYGGWVSFTSHLCLKTNGKLFKIGNRSEKSTRKYGYGVEYQNLAISDIQKLDNLLITAIDKNYYKYLNDFPDGTHIVIHDPTEVKGRSCQPVIDNLKRFNVVTIRKTVQEFLLNKFGIESNFLLHPFYEFNKTNIEKTNKAVSISRIDYDKHTEIILEANKKLENKIDIYGYRKLGELDLDSCYRGRFEKSFIELDKILGKSKYVVDMSAIKNDGGGSQYTFLESIYENCVLILSDKWIEGIVDSVYVNGINCHIVSDFDELVNIINLDGSQIELSKNAYKLLQPHIDVDWNVLMKKKTGT